MRTTVPRYNYTNHADGRRYVNVAGTWHSGFIFKSDYCYVNGKYSCTDYKFPCVEQYFTLFGDHVTTNYVVYKLYLV